MIPEKPIPPEGDQDSQEACELWRYPSAPKSPTVRCDTPSSIDCLMPNPRPGDVNRVLGTSGWREGVTAPSLTCLVPVPGCLLGRTCNLLPYTAGRPKIYPYRHLCDGSLSGHPTFGTAPSRGTLYPNRVRPRIVCTMHGCGARMCNNSKRRRRKNR